LAQIYDGVLQGKKSRSNFTIDFDGLFLYQGMICIPGDKESKGDIGCSS